ncbi:hypothetical protein BH23BAC1_BH23BAC1_43780 [soil metagenome]
MKKLLIFVFAICTLSFIACDNNDDEAVIPKTSESAPPVTITSIYPESAKSGTDVAIFGENFGETVTDNYVTLNGWDAEIVQVPYQGMVLVRIPLSLQPGNYTIRLSAHGQTCSAPKYLKVVEESNQSFKN